MKQKLLCLLLLLAAGTMIAAARGGSQEKKLRRYFSTLCKMPGARVDAVEYTGGFSSEIRGFTWQRGDGNGWTRGQRVILTVADSTVVDSLYHQFQRIDFDQFTRVARNACTTYFEA